MVRALLLVLVGIGIGVYISRAVRSRGASRVDPPEQVRSGRCKECGRPVARTDRICPSCGEFEPVAEVEEAEVVR